MTALPGPPPDPEQAVAGLRVVRGEPDEAELAALVAGLMSVTAEEEEPRRADAWTDRARHLELPPAPGPDRWRWSLHP